MLASRIAAPTPPTAPSPGSTGPWWNAPAPLDGDSPAAPQPPTLPPPSFAPSTEFSLVATRTSAAAENGAAIAAQYLTAHPVRDDVALARFAGSLVTPPPKDATTRLEREFMRRIVDRRNARDNDTALYFGRYGYRQLWHEVARPSLEAAGPAQAAAAQSLLTDALALAGRVNLDAKSQFRRPRPYVEDPNLPPLPGSIPPGGGSGPDTFSYPSGHAAAAYAAATVLGRAFPERAGEFTALAEQVAFARVYAAVHHPSDVAMGAALGATIGAALAGARPVPKPQTDR